MGESDFEESGGELVTMLDGAVSSGSTLAPEMEGALLERHKIEPLASDRYVAVVTGRRS